jgi:hypothetical protein
LETAALPIRATGLAVWRYFIFVSLWSLWDRQKRQNLLSVNLSAFFFRFLVDV